MPTEGKNTCVVLVGYRTKLIDNVDSYMPRFTPPANYKDPVKIEEWIANKKESFKHAARYVPHLATLDEVEIQEPGKIRPWYGAAKDRQAGSGREPLCLALRNYLIGTYENSWFNEIVPPQPRPRVIFLGFNPRAFVKILAAECSLPTYNMGGVLKTMPLSFWYGSNDYRDITRACIPEECDDWLDWHTVFKIRGIKVKDGWLGPGEDPIEDVRLTMELGGQLGLIQVG